METSASIPEILIPAAPELTGAGPAPMENPATPAARDAGADAASPGKKSSFSHTFKELHDNPATSETPADAPSAPVSAPEPTPVATPAEADTRLQLANLAPASELPGSGSEMAAATANGKTLPHAGETLPELPSAETEIPTLAAPKPMPADGQASDARTAIPAATLTAFAEAQARTPAAGATSAAEIVSATAGAATSTPSANFAGLPANLAQGTKPGSSPATEVLPPSLDSESLDLKPATEAPAQNLRSILMQALAADSPRITLPQLTDTGIAAPMSQAPAHTTAAFTDTLAALTTPTDQPTLQPTGDRQVFTQGLGERLMMMADNGIQSARIKLYPEHLGPLDIKVQVDDDIAKVWFHAQHGQTREALEQALPRLREMFADQGLQLVRSDVSGHGDAFGSNMGHAEDNNGPPQPGNGNEIEAELPAALTASMRISAARLLDVRA